MAQIVLGIGTAHTPQLHTPAEQWQIRAEQDRGGKVPLVYRGEVHSFADLKAKRAGSGFTYDAAQGETYLKRGYQRLDELHDLYARTAPDVMVIFGNDQTEIFDDRLNPAFAILGGAEFDNMPRTHEQLARLPAGIAIADPGHLPDTIQNFPGSPQLAHHLVSTLTAQSFDVAWSLEQPRAQADISHLSGMPHAFGFIYQQIMRDRVIPHVPLVMNTFLPPNQPTAARCLAFGRAIGQAIRDWDSPLRIAIASSGGLSHFVVDEDWDADTITGLIEGDLDRIAQYPESYFQTGNSEVKSWIAAAGALESSGLQPALLDYFPLYRTEAGTGSSCAFMSWTA